LFVNLWQNRYYLIKSKNIIRKDGTGEKSRQGPALGTVLKKVIIKKSSAAKLASYFPWVYDNEILELSSDSLKAGDIVEVVTKKGAFLGMGYFNPRSVITVRMLSFQREEINKQFFVEKIRRAFEARRDILRFTDSCRIVYSEADGLPGLIADLYNGFLVVQINTMGMEKKREIIIDAFMQVVDLKGIYEKSDPRSRQKEGLGTEECAISGDVPDRLKIQENGINFLVEIRGSQKTGFYLDQRRNRFLTAARIEAGMQVLDIFSNTGAFGIYAARKGARVKAVDVSQPALDVAAENALLNGVQIETVKSDAFDFLDESVNKGSRADAVILDPPPFSRSRGARQGAISGLKHLVLQGLRILNREGLLAVFSCSHHITANDLVALSQEAAQDTRSRLEITDFLFQDLDHPYIINIPQSLYLKGLLLKKHN
jgi:23S rRNA (cytosine1962-C5)-methyltransferase